MHDICRILMGKSSIEFESISVSPSTTLTELISKDKNFGLLRPKNGKYFTWAILNTDTELSFQQMKNIIEDVCTAYIIEYQLKFKFTTNYDDADIKISFATEEDDRNLTSNTIAYMGYPQTGSVFYGITVINKKYLYSHSGLPMLGHQLKALGLPVQFLDGSYSTLYLVKIMIHEFGHGVLGLQHDNEPNSIMSSNESAMSDYWSERDLARGTAKVPRKNRLARHLKRLRNWFVGASKR